VDPLMTIIGHGEPAEAVRAIPPQRELDAAVPPPGGDADRPTRFGALAGQVRVPFQRRRAERFAELLDETSATRRRHVRSAVDHNLTALVSLSRRVGTLRVAVAVDRGFRADLRARLLARIGREGIGVTATGVEVEPPTRRRLAGLLPGTRTPRWRFRSRSRF